MMNFVSLDDVVCFSQLTDSRPSCTSRWSTAWKRSWFGCRWTL